MPYHAKGRVIWKDSTETKHNDGSSSFSLAFPVCEMHECLAPPMAETIAEIMNRGEAAIEAD